MVAHGSAWRVCIRTWRPYRGLAHSTLGIRGWIFLGRLPPPPPGQNPKEAPAVQSGHAHAPGAAEAPLGCFSRAAFPPRGGPGGGIFQGGRGKKETPGGLEGLRLKENQRKYKPPGGCSEGLVDAGRPRHHPHHNPNQHSRRAMRL